MNKNSADRSESRYEYYIQNAKKYADQVTALGTNDAKQMVGGLSKGMVLSIQGALMIQLNFVYNAEKNEYVLAYTAVSFGVMGTLSKSFYTLVGYVPVFINIAANAALDIVVSGGSNEEENLAVISESEFQKYPGNLEQLLRTDTGTRVDLTGKVTGTAGVGLCGVLSARGGLSMVVQFQFKNGNSFIDGFVFGISMVLAFDLFVGTVSVDVLSPTIGTGTLEGQNGVSVFGGLGEIPTTSKSSGTYALRSSASEDSEEVDRKILVESDDGTVLAYQEASAGTADMSNFGGRSGMVRATLEAVSKNILLENAAERTRPQLIKLDDGRMLLAFIGARSEEDPTQVLYYAYHDGTSWQAPQIVCDDGTFDSTPSLLKVGDKVVLSWADAKRSFTEEDTLKTKLQSLEIAYAVLDTQTGTMGEKIVFTDDSYFNFAPRLSLADNTVYCNYMKRDIDAVTKEDDLLNLEGLYSTMAYVSYDLTDGSKETEQFITLRHPTMTDPLTMDYNSQTIVIDGTTYMVSTYTVDEDMDITTQNGKSLWVEITDLTAKKTYYPINLSSKDVSVASPKLDVLKDSLYLTYVEDGEKFCLMDMGRLMRDLFEEDAAGDVYRNAATDERYWYKKTAQALGLDDETYENSVYDHLNQDRFPVDCINFHVDEENTSTPAEFVLTTNGDDLYVFYTDKSRTDDYSLGNELFCARYAINNPDDEADDFEETGFSKASQITSYGKAIDELTLVMDEYSVVNLVANHYSIEADSEDRIQIGTNSLVEIKFVPSGSLFVDEDLVEFEGNMIVGEETQINFEVVNNGVLPTSGYDLTVKLEKNGSETEVYTVTRENLHLDTGEGNAESFSLPVTEDMESALLNIYIREHDTNDTNQKWIAGVDVPYYDNVVISKMAFEEENGETYLCLEYKNTGAKASEAIAAKTEVITANDDPIRTLDTFEVPALASGETFTRRVKFEPEVSDYNSFGLIYVRNSGEVDGEEVFSRVTHKAYIAPQAVQINDGANKMELQKGEQTKLDVVVAPYASMAGKVVFSSSNPNVATVDDEGNVTAIGGGKAEITVLYPEVGLSETIQVVVPGEPDEPGEPVEPDEPDEPVEPDEPDEPVEPDEPDEPDKPCKPEKPSWTDWLKNFFTNFGKHYKHVWDKGKVTKEATCTENGVKTYTCSTCGKTKTERIKATGHQFKEGICQDCGHEQETMKPEKPNKPGWCAIWDQIFYWWK